MWKVIRQFKNDMGYIVYVGNNKLMKKCRYELMKKMGRKALFNMYVHHINRIRTDDTFKNLVICTYDEHNHLHYLLERNKTNLYNLEVNKLRKKYKMEKLK
jgi:hypothetical protein